MIIVKRALALCLCLLLALAAPCAAHAEPETVRVGWWYQPRYMETDGDGHPYGYLYEYLVGIAQFTGWRYEYVPLTLAEAYRQLRTGEIDLLGCLFSDEARVREVRLSRNSAGDEKLVLYAPADSPLAAGATDGLRAAVLRDSYNEREARAYAERCGLDLTLLPADSMEAVERLLRDGEANAAIAADGVRGAGTRVLAELGERPFYMATARTERGLALGEALDAAMDAISRDDPKLHQRLRDLYLDASDASAVTEAEAAAVRALGVLTVGCEAARSPLITYQNGEAAGVARRVLEHLAGELGATLSFVSAETDASPALLAVLADPEAAIERGYRMTASYLSLPLMAVYAGEAPDLSDAAVLRDFNVAKPIAGLEATTAYATPEECLEAVLAGARTSALVNGYAAETLLKHARYSAMRREALEGVFARYCFGVREDLADVLLPLLDRGLTRLTDAERNEYVIASALDAQEINLDAIFTRLPSDVMLVAAALGLLIALLAALLWLRGKRQRVEKARATEFSLYMSYICKATDAVSEVDLAAGRRARYSMTDGEIRRTVKPLGDALFDPALVHPDDRELAQTRTSPEALRRLVDEQAESSLEFRLREREDAPYQWTRVLLQGMARDKVHPCNFMMYCMNIDATRRAEEEKKRQLEAALALAEQASAAKGQFTARISHEIRSPLNAVLGYLTLAKRSTDDREKLMDCFSKSELAARHLLELINDVLDMASIENGKMQINHAPFDLRELLDTVGSIYGSQARSRGIDFTLETEAITAPRLIGDGLRVRQVLVNLLSNAVKFTPKDGRICLRAEQRELRPGVTQVDFTVSDTGVGMSEAFQKRLFSAFTQQDANIALRYGGSGLGMNISKNLTELMGGDISVESRENVGTTFTVRLPFEADASVPAPAQEAPSYDFSGRTLLLAEDNEMNLEIAKELLELAGFTVVGAVNGREAVDFFAASEPGALDAILMDVQMPVLDGYAATREIRALPHPRAQAVPIIAMTANAFAEDVKRALDAGMNDHISKPVDIDVLVRKLAEALEK